MYAPWSAFVIALVWPSMHAYKKNCQLDRSASENSSSGTHPLCQRSEPKRSQDKMKFTAVYAFLLAAFGANMALGIATNSCECEMSPA